MKVLYRYIIKSFIGPMALTLVIALFILLMQFLWKYIDDLVGKGLGWFVIIKFMLWVSLYLIPLALPMAILLASIMTFGNLAENSELVALKSSGLSLPKIITPLASVVLLISIGAFIFANYCLPVVNLKMNSLLWDIQNTKPALNLQPDVFYNGINGYSIRIGQKDPDQITLHNILIYDHTANMGNIKTELAKSGKIRMSTDLRYMVLEMDDGNSYEDMLDNNQASITHPLLINHFKKQTIYFDLSSFRFSRTKEDLFKSDYQMMDMRQLSNSADSITKNLEKSKNQFSKQLKDGFLSVRNYPHYIAPVRPLVINNNKKNKVNKTIAPVYHKPEYDAIQKRMMLVDAASNTVRNAKETIEQTSVQFDSSHESVIQRNLEWERKFTFPFACLLLFFIGAPLGAIIKRGGLGMPVVVAAGFFVIYYVISIIGLKSAKEEAMTVFIGSWLSSISLIPIAIFLTYKAAVDSAIFERDAYLNFFKKVVNIFLGRRWI